MPGILRPRDQAFCQDIGIALSPQAGGNNKYMAHMIFLLFFCTVKRYIFIYRIAVIYYTNT